MMGSNIRYTTHSRQAKCKLAYSGLFKRTFQNPTHRQLDYILHSPEIEVQNFFVPQVRFSHHMPLVCDFEVQDTQRHAAMQTIDNLPYYKDC